MEHSKPRILLKDFLNENNSNSCSSSGFKSLPRKPNNSSPKDLNSRNSYPRIWSKTRLTKSVFQTFLNAVKAISFTAVKKSQPSMISTETKATVKIKDIMRWKVCRDPAVVAAEEPPSPATTGWSSKEWSWSESDCTLSSWDAPNDDVEDTEFSLFSFSPHGSEDSVGAATGKAKMGNKEVLICQKEEQQSPISVLQVGEDEFSSFDQTLLSIKRRNQNFIQHIQKFESLDNNDDDNEDEEDCVEKWARELLHCVKAIDSVQNSKANYDKLLLDIFKDELNARRSDQTRNADEFGLEMLRIAKDWIDGSFAYDSEHDNKEACIKEMDWRVRWGRFEFEEVHEELALDIETAILHSLVFELLGLDLEVTH
ncbi:uncharacterized protein LOC133286511 [Gastrolobium bilobum]|uniref:uncharacterized protein LOC133286511 n=1 Tax=Gastrolobium bilobum TaxID=150636 RepID=UPI002AB09F9A|nr:uncharacterized protein LOC133286511 [Gastrolobium bilobum]